MPLPTSGPISFLDIQNEFGGSNPISINEYYKGGTYVSESVAEGVGSSQTAPLPDAAPSGVTALTGDARYPTIQMSMFRGTQPTIFGSPGTISFNPSADFQDIVLPAGVRYLRFYLVGGGGGGGGSNLTAGGAGGAGSTLSGTIDTIAFGGTSADRTIRVFIGRGGQGGIYGSVNYFSNQRAEGGHGYPLVPMNWTPVGQWSTWMNTYAVNDSQVRDAQGQTFPGTFAFSRTLDFPVSGNYTFQAQSDNYGSISVDGTEVLAIPDGTYAAFSPSQTTYYVSAGTHTLSFTYANYEIYGGLNPGGIAIRILKPDASEFYTTRYDSEQPAGYPVGGAGGYPGQYGYSGFGGGGGSATWFQIITSTGIKYPIALAGGGGGGGGGAHYTYVNKNGNCRNQGVQVGGTPVFVSGGEGESIDYLNGGGGTYGTISNPSSGGFDWFRGQYVPAGTYPYYYGAAYSDGGGGGGGGGGLLNPRLYNDGRSPSTVNTTTRLYKYSGMGGKRAHWEPYGADDGDAEGGESGRSWINSSATTFADLVHGVSKTSTPLWPAGIPAGAASITSYGLGGGGAPVIHQNGTGGTNGIAYFDWGYTTPSVAAPSITRQSITATAFPLGIQRSVLVDTAAANMTFVVDAYGAGGNPQPEYSYLWEYNSGNAVTIHSPTSARTSITTATHPQYAFDEGTGTSNLTILGGTIRCTVSDSTGSAVVVVQWNLAGIIPAPVLPPESTGG